MYALSEKNIEAQIQLFKRNNWNKGEFLQSSGLKLQKHLDFAESSSTDDPELSINYKVRNELYEQERKLGGLMSFQPLVEHFNQPGIYIFIQKMQFCLFLQYFGIFLVMEEFFFGKTPDLR